MYKPNGLDRQSLQTPLENYKLIAEVNQELLDINQFTKGDIPGKLELAQELYKRIAAMGTIRGPNKMSRCTNERQYNYRGSRYCDQAYTQSRNFPG